MLWSFTQKDVLIFHALIFNVLLWCLYASFLDRSRVIASIEFYAVFVKYAEHGTTAFETTGSPYFINRMSCNIKIDDSLLSIELAHLRRLYGWLRDYHLFLQIHHVLGRLAYSKDFFWQRTHHDQNIRWLCFGKQNVVGVNLVMYANDANDL